jgi:DNA polymerase III subunit beta
MQFTITQKDLAHRLAWVARALPARPAVPVLTGVLMTVTADGTVRFAAFDNEQSATATAADAVTDATPGQALVSGRLLTEIVRALPDAPVTVTDDNGRVRITAGTAKFSMPTMETSMYPELPLSPHPIGSVSSTDLAAAVKAAATAASRDAALPSLTAVEVTADPQAGTLTVTATDRYRLATRTINYTPTPGAEPAQWLVPARSLADFTKALPHTDVQLGAGTGDAALFALSTDNLHTAGRVIGGQFPAWKALLPAAHDIHATVAATDLIDAVKRVQLVGDGAPIRLTFTPGSLAVEVGHGGDQDASAQEAVDAELTGIDEFTIAFNAQYLLDGLAVCASETVTFGLIESAKPAVLTGVDNTESRYLLMPVRVNSR